MKRILIASVLALIVTFTAVQTVSAESLLGQIFGNGSGTINQLNVWKVVSGFLTPTNSSNGVKVPQLGGSGTRCVEVDNNGTLSKADDECGTGGTGTNYWSNTGDTTTLDTGSVASAGSFYATSTTNTSLFKNVSVEGSLSVASTSNASVIIGDVSGNSRGQYSLDIQSSRTQNTQVSSGAISAAIGILNTSSGVNSFTFGLGNTSSVGEAVAMGLNNTVSGLSSTAIGNANNISGNFATAIGIQNISSGFAASTFGPANTASAQYSMTIGNNMTNNISSSIMIGSFDDVSSVFGNILLAPTGGSVGVGTTSPYEKLSVVGKVVAASYVATTTATSTSNGGWDISGGCYAISGTCITGGGSGTNYWTNSGVTTTLNTGSVASAGTFNATSTTASVFPYASTTAISASGNGYFAGTIQAGSSVVPVANSGWFQQGLGTDHNQSYRGKLVAGTVVDLMKVNGSNQTNFQSASDGFVWRNAAGNSTRARLLDTGNFGIGTTTPGTMLSLGDTGNDTINISPTATSTFGSGINLRTGCFSINDVCVTGSGSGVSGGTAGMLTSWVNSTTLTATGTPTATAYVATSTTATSTFAGKMSIGTSTQNLNSSSLKTLYLEGLANNYNVSSAGILQINTPGDNDSPGTSDFSAKRGLFFGIDTNTVSNAGSGFIQYYGGTGVNPARNLALNPNGGGVVLNGIFGETSTSFPVSIVGNTSANALVKIQNISTAGGTLTTPYAGFTFQTYNTVNTYEKGGIIVQDMEGGSCCYLRQKMRFLLNPTASNANVQDTVEASTIMTLGYKNGYGTASNLTNPVVGIGSTTPYAKLSVHALSNEGNSTLFAIASSTPTATTTHFVVNADGNTGVGTSSPYSKLSVAGQVVASNYLATTSSSNLGYSWANDPDTGISNFSANQIAFYNGGFQTWYIDSAGVIRGNISNAGIVSQSDVIVSNDTGKIGVSTTTPFGKLSATGTEGDSSLPVLLIASSTNNPLFTINGAGHIRTGGGTPTVSTCGTSPSISGNDTAGTVTVGSGVVTACTITFAKTRSNTPRVVGVVTGGGLNIAGGYSAKSTSAITFSFAATVGSGTFDYYIVE